MIAHLTGIARARFFIATTVFGAAALTGACVGDGGDPGDEIAWLTSVDSAGDTTLVRITGEVPPGAVRSLVPELRVGAEDGGEEETFGSISTVFGTPDGGLVLHDAQATAIRMFDSLGAYVRTVGAKGGGPGEYGHLNGLLRMPDGRLVAWDAAGGRLNFYATTGDFLNTARMPFNRSFSTNTLHSDASGKLYVNAVLERDSVDFSRSKGGFIKMDVEGTVLDSIPYVHWMEPAPPLTGSSADGGSRMAWGMPFAAGSVTRLLPSGGFVTGPTDKYVFYLVHADGSKPVRIEREHVPVAVSPTEASERRAQIEQSMKRVNPAWSWTGSAIPSQKPAYRDILVGRDGRIWVSLSTPAEPIPEEELLPVLEGAPPTVRLTTREPVVYDVFSSSGRLLGRVALPPKTTLYTMEGAHAWGVQRDSLDVEYAVRFRIEPAFPTGR